jgi:hypothetical protein
VLADDRRYPADVRSAGANELVATVPAVLERWDPAVREIVRQSDPRTAASYSFRATDPASDLALQRIQAEMATYAPAAVGESLVPVRWIKALRGPAATVAARAAFPLLSAPAGGLRAARRRSAA